MQKLIKDNIRQSSNSFGTLAGIAILLLLIFLTNPVLGNLSSAIYWGVTFLCLGIMFARICLLKKAIKINSFVGWYLLFFCLCIASLLYSADTSASTEVLKSMVVNCAVLFLIMWTIETKEDLNAVIKILLWVIVFNAIFLYFTVDWSMFGVERMENDASGYGWNVNDIGLMMLWGIIISCYLAKTYNKKLYYCFILFFIPLILYSGSRKAWIAAILFSFVMIYINNKRRLLLSLLISALVLFIVYTLIINVEFLYNAGGNRLVDFFNGFFGTGEYDSSAMLREKYISLGWQWFLENPVFGRGINAYRYLLKYEMGRYTYSHNNFIELLVDVGVVGFLSFYSMYFKIVVDGVKKFFKKNIPAPTVILIALIILNLVLHYAMVMYQSLLDLILLLVVYLHFTFEDEEKSLSL